MSDDLTGYFSLQDRVKDLEAELKLTRLKLGRNSKNKLFVKSVQAKTAIQLKSDGLLDLTAKQIAFRYSLSVNTIGRYSKEIENTKTPN